MNMMAIMMILVIVVFIICSIVLISLLGRKNAMECFYIENEILYLNSLFVKKIPLSDIDHIEFYYIHARVSYRGLIKIYKKDTKIVRRFFQTSKMVFFVTEQMISDEIQKLTPTLKEYSIPYTIKND